MPAELLHRLGGALRQLLMCALPLDNPPLLVVSDRLRLEIHTHFTGTPSERRTVALEDITRPVVQLAGDCAEVFALRAHDSVQLAALQTLRLQAAVAETTMGDSRRPSEVRLRRAFLWLRPGLWPLNLGQGPG